MLLVLLIFPPVFLTAVDVPVVVDELILEFLRMILLLLLSTPSALPVPWVVTFTKLWFTLVVAWLRLIIVD